MSDALRELALKVAGFYITDRAMQRAQAAFEAALASGRVSDADRRAYCKAVRTYFDGFERDARAQLKSVDRELDGLYQRQYNLVAERGVAQKRIEAVQGVLASLQQIES